METIKSSQILVRVALICAMATASKPSTRLSASDEPPQKKPKTDQHKRPIATPLASRDGFIQYNDLKDEIIQAPERRLVFNRNGQKLNGSQVKHLMKMFAMTSKNEEWCRGLLTP